MKTWFTSDYHLGHANIIKYCGRPFKNVNEMNETIIKNHNKRVAEDDIVFFLGDFCFRNTAGGKPGEGVDVKAPAYIKRLKGNIVFIQGNHDKNNSLNTPLKSAVIFQGKKNIQLVHNPNDADARFKLVFNGHVHEHWKVKTTKKGQTFVNVGVDQWNFAPVSFNELMQEVQRFKRK